jgi:hypothetical protein
MMMMIIIIIMFLPSKIILLYLCTYFSKSLNHLILFRNTSSYCICIVQQICWKATDSLNCLARQGLFTDIEHKLNRSPWCQLLRESVNTLKDWSVYR